MRTVTYGGAVSLDGFLAGVDGARAVAFQEPSISARKRATLNSFQQKSRASYFRNHALPFLTPTDKGSSCVRGSATPCKPEHTSLAIAAVRRPLLFRSNETDKTRRADRSTFPRLADFVRIAFAVLYKPLSRPRIVCSSFVFSPLLLSLKPVHFARQRW